MTGNQPQSPAIEWTFRIFAVVGMSALFAMSVKLMMAFAAP